MTLVRQRGCAPRSKNIAISEREKNVVVRRVQNTPLRAQGDMPYAHCSLTHSLIDPTVDPNRALSRAHACQPNPFPPPHLPLHQCQTYRPLPTSTTHTILITHAHNHTISPSPIAFPTHNPLQLLSIRPPLVQDLLAPSREPHVTVPVAAIDEPYILGADQPALFALLEGFVGHVLAVKVLHVGC